MDNELPDAEILERLQNWSELGKRKRGRPPSLQGADLQVAYADLVLLLSQHWALIGWELQHARTVPQLRAAFELLKETYAPRLELFRREGHAATTTEHLRRMRQELKEVSEFLFKALESKSECERFAESGRAALKKPGRETDFRKLHHVAANWENKLREELVLSQEQGLERRT